MILPLVMIVVAVLAAALASYGTSATWVTLWGDTGLELIFLSRRLQWPLFALCLLAAAALIALVVSGKRRVWWLIGLAPVLALFAHRFATSPMRDFRVIENPVLVTADAAAHADTNPHGLTDDDFVVGIVVPPGSGGAGGGGGGGAGGGEAIAYPYAMLWRAPLVVQTVREQRVAVLWSPLANFARAHLVDRDLSPREIEPVSMPANALLLYNARYGEFINSVSGLTQHGKPPTGFRQPIPVAAMTFGRWRSLYPDTRVAAPPPRTDTAAWVASVPLRPRQPMPTRPSPDQPAAAVEAWSGVETPVVVVWTASPMVLLPTDISDIPLNLTVAGQPVLVLRDERTRRVLAFSRQLGDSVLRFAVARDGPAGNLVLREVDSNTRWSTRGACQEPTGPWAGRQLPTVGIFEGGYFEVLRYWMPDLIVHHVTAEDFVELPPPPPPPPPPTRPARRTSPQRR